MLLLVDIYLFLQKQCYERNKLLSHGSSYVKMIFILSPKVFIFYMLVFIVLINVFGIE